MKKRRLGILLGLLILLVLPATPVYADTPYPDSAILPPTFNVYEDLRESGDMLFVIYANIPYATTPAQPVTETYFWSLVDPDTDIEIGNTTGYAYNVGTYQEDGFGYLVASMYFNAIEVTASLSWGEGYEMKLIGNPAVFDDPPVYSFIIPSSAYNTETDHQRELADRVLALATDLNVKWELASAYSLLIEEETGSTLSPYGQAYFRGAIYGLNTLAPAVFPVEFRQLEIADRDWDEEYSENVTGQWAGTWVQTAQEGGKALFGTDYDLFSIIILLGMCGGLMIGNIMITGDHWNGFIDVAIVMCIGARLGMYDLGFLILVAALCWIYIASKVWFGVIK